MSNVDMIVIEINNNQVQVSDYFS